MGGYAWVTLATNDAYSLGALVLANSLRRVGTKYETAILITPGVKQEMRDKLSAVFRVVQEVNVLDSKDEANLALLKRPELGVTFTKLHCWRLTQFDKCVFLDADTLIVRNCDELFDREEFSAAPDVGWPDCFNSGVFVYKPSEETFASILKLAMEKGSFDGGDQGLLNLYFSDWAHKDISKHLPFIYNMCSTAVYSYLPAFKQFGEDVRIIHFIGETKPWLQYFDTVTGIVRPPPGNTHLQPLLQLWWNIFFDHVYSQLNSSMGSSIQAPIWHDLEISPNNSSPIKPADFSEFHDPWFDYRQDKDPFIQPDNTNNDSPNQDQYYNVTESNSPETEFPTTSSESLIDQYVVITSLEYDNQSSCISENNDEHINDRIESPLPLDDDKNDDNVVNVEINDRLDVSNLPESHNNPESPSLVTNSSNNAKLPQIEHGGLAGALASMTLGEPRTSEQNALEEHMRKQSWEYGNIDYLGKDSFDNIWKKIGQTLAEKPTEPLTTIIEKPAAVSSEVLEKESSSQDVKTPSTVAEDESIVLERKALSESFFQTLGTAVQPSSAEPSVIKSPQEESQISPQLPKPETSPLSSTCSLLPEQLQPAPVVQAQQQQISSSTNQPEASPKSDYSKPSSLDLFEPLSYSLTMSQIASQPTSPAQIPVEEVNKSLQMSTTVSQQQTMTSPTCPVVPKDSPSAQPLQPEKASTQIEVQAKSTETQVAIKPTLSLLLSSQPESSAATPKAKKIEGKKLPEPEACQLPPIPLPSPEIQPSKLIASPPPAEPSPVPAAVESADSTVPIQVAESVLHTEVKESVSEEHKPLNEEALSSVVASPVRESVAAISESTILQSTVPPTIEQSVSTVQAPPPAAANGFVQPEVLSALPPLPDVHKKETVSTVHSQVQASPSVETPKPQVPTQVSSQPSTVSKPPEVTSQSQQPMTPASQEKISEEKTVAEARKLELKIPQSSGESASQSKPAQIPPTPTVIEPTPPTSPPLSAEMQETKEEKKDVEKKKKLTSKGSIEGESGEPSKKPVKKVVKKVIKKKDSTEDAGEGSSTTKKTTKTVKKVSKSPQQSLETDDSIPPTPPPVSTEAPIPPKRRVKSTKSTAEKKSDDSK